MPLVLWGAEEFRDFPILNHFANDCNINFLNRVGQQALDSRDRFINTTSGAIGILHGERDITKEDIGVKDAMKLKVEDFVSKENSMHWHTVKRAHVYEILKKHLPEKIMDLSKNREPPVIPPINVLTLQKSE